MNGLKKIENRSQNIKGRVFFVYCPKNSDWNVACNNSQIAKDLEVLNLNQTQIEQYQGNIIGAVKLSSEQCDANRFGLFARLK